MKKWMILIIAMFVFSLFIGVNAFAQTQTKLEPYSRGGTEFTSLHKPLYIQYDWPRYNPFYLLVPQVVPPQVPLQPYANVQPLDNENLTASTSRPWTQLQPYASAD